MADKLSPQGLKELVERLSPIADAGDIACLKGTPMVPLHKSTIREIVDYLKDWNDSVEFARYVQSGGRPS